MWEHKKSSRKHPQNSHVEETMDVKWCVSKVFQYIIMSLSNTKVEAYNALIRLCFLLWFAKDRFPCDEAQL